MLKLKVNLRANNNNNNRNVDDDEDADDYGGNNDEMCFISIIKYYIQNQGNITYLTYSNRDVKNCKMPDAIQIP